MTFTLILANDAAAPVYVSNLNDLSTVDLDSNIGVDAAVAPHVGLAWTPTERALVTATVHSPSAFKIRHRLRLHARHRQRAVDLAALHALVHAAAARGRRHLAARRSAWSVIPARRKPYARWSHYRDRHDERAERRVRVERHADAERRACAGATAPNRALARRDLRADAGAAADRAHQLRRQRSARRHRRRRTCSVGWGSRFRVGIDVIGQRLIARHVTKFVSPAGESDPQYVLDEVPDDAIDVLGQPVPNRTGLQTNNPGFPGFASSGWLLGGGVHVAIEY